MFLGCGWSLEVGLGVYVFSQNWLILALCDIHHSDLLTFFTPVGVDYDLPTVTITVPANETMGCGNITITDDSLVEEDESFTVCTSLSDCANVTINDNDGRPELYQNASPYRHAEL